ncbi:feruloyl-CoA synthase [uncultured Caballeronia sp.]|uniref:feruloyl-CoA synthase n=1 Tax=uncultured Caballeronia sp. TaxID=1827198 RepID=UPI0035C9BA39
MLREETAGSGFRPVAVHVGAPGIEQIGDAWYLEPLDPLRPYPERLTDCLVGGALRHPERWLAASRNITGSWTGISYALMLERARSIGQGLLDLKLPSGRPIVILSGNSLEHLQLMLGAMFAGIPVAPLSPAWALPLNGFVRLQNAIGFLDPAMVFADDYSLYAEAIEAAVHPDVLVVSREQTGRSLSFDTLCEVDPTIIDTVHGSIGPDTIAKILFTSGSTNLPKPVPTTHRMLCSNQQMLLQTFPQFAIEPPVLVDWLPWHHTYGGSHNVGIALYNGGTLYIDEGKPIAERFGQTLRNLRDIAPTAYFNVPKGWEDLVAALEVDAGLGHHFFSRLKLMFFAGAGLSRTVRDRMDEVSKRYCGERVRVVSGLGMTETSPACLFTIGDVQQERYIGLPAPGCKVKLAPVHGKLELRYRGPHVMHQYMTGPANSLAGAFDEEGFFCSGDAAVFYDPVRPELGLLFDGRIADDFKLNTGVFVNATALRERAVALGAPYVRDAIPAGMGHSEVGLLVFPDVVACATLGETFESGIHSSSQVRAYFADLLQTLNKGSTGSASRIAWLHLLETAPCAEAGELTDKGTISMRAVLAHRSALVETLFAEALDGVRTLRADQTHMK